ncbi:MAG: GEVED domain-containing protein [Candidatus Zixiibacteriota bacterium]
MTNLRKSYVPVFAVLALAFCIMMIGQAAADSRKLGLSRITEDEFGVPLPSEDVVVKEAVKVREGDRLATDGQSYQGAVRGERPKAALSANGGGDTYALATVIPAVPYSDMGTTVGFAYDYNSSEACRAASGGAHGAPDVVYSYTAASDGMLFVSTCQPGTLLDSRVWVVESVSLTEVGCNDDGCPSYASELTAPVSSGLTYFIVIGGWNAAQADVYELFVDLFAPGTVCEAPLPIQLPTSNIPETASWPVDMTLGFCGYPDATGLNAGAFYYEFTALATGFYTFEFCDDGTVPNTGFLGIATGVVCYAGATCYGYTATPGEECADVGPFTCGAVLLAGQTTIIEIFDWCDGMQGTLTASVAELPLYNDDCADAEDLLVGTVTDHFVHNVNATRDGPGVDLCATADPSEICADVWYVWEADADGYARISFCDGSADHRCMVYAGDECLSVNPRESIASGCSDDGCGVGGGPPFAEVPCQTGDRFLIRMGGWFIEGDPDYGDCSAFGMGVGELDIEVFPTSIRPANDGCSGLVPAVVAGDGSLTSFTAQTTAWGGWDCLPTLPRPYEVNVWYAISTAYCADTLEVNMCGTIDGSLYNIPTSYVPMFTGCPCDGAYVTFYPAVRILSTTRCQAFGFPTTHDRQFAWVYRAVIPGDYYWGADRYSIGGNATGDPTPWHVDEFRVNFRAIAAPCVYCAASGNPNSCPPVAGATWIDRVTFAAIQNPAPPATSGCMAYQDFTAVTGGKVYRGFDYTLTVRYGRTGGGALGSGDSMDVWVDWNQNSGFAANQTETFERTTLSRVGPDMVGTVSVPMAAQGPGGGATGTTIMRVRIANAADGGNAPCGNKTWGEVEDYLLQVYDLECGDFNIDGNVDATDIAFLWAWYQGAGPAPDFYQRADIDGDGFITLADVVALVEAAYNGGPLNCMP